MPTVSTEGPDEVSRVGPRVSCQGFPLVLSRLEGGRQALKRRSCQSEGPQDTRKHSAHLTDTLGPVEAQNHACGRAVRPSWGRSVSYPEMKYMMFQGQAVKLSEGGPPPPPLKTLSSFKVKSGSYLAARIQSWSD